MTAALVAPLTWPPADTDQPPRWPQLLLHTIADATQGLWRAHQQLNDLLAELADHPPDPGQLAPHLRVIDQHAVPRHDSVYLHQLLRDHGLDHVTARLSHADDHRLRALQALRHLTDLDDRGWLDAATMPARLHHVLDDLAAAGHALVQADHDLVNALDIPPNQGGDCYPQ
jgi:uncharacterized protein (DUF58 family)